MKKILFTLALATLFFTVYAKDYPDCKDSKKGDKCYILLKDIYPTQANVGEYQVQEKNLPYYQKDSDAAWDSKHSVGAVVKAVSKQQEKKKFPVIKSPNGNFYLVDRHHNTRAIYELYKKYNEDKKKFKDFYKDPLEVKILVKLEKDYSDLSSMDNFWKKMIKKNYFWPYTFNGVGYVAYDYSQLPDSIAKLHNDPYRSAIGLARKQGDFKKPKGDNVYFYQFKWGKCAEQLGFIEPLKFDGTERVVTKSINFLKDNADQMIKECTDKSYENMPKPIY